MVKKRISLNVEILILKKWDELADSVGLNRTAMIHSAVVVYDLFVKNQLKEQALKQELFSLKEKLREWGKDLNPEDLRSVITQIKDPVTKLIVQKLLLNQN